MAERYEQLVIWLDKVATIKAGAVGTAITSGIGYMQEIDWMMVLGIAVALLTALAQAVKIWAIIRGDALDQAEHQEKRKV